MITKERAEALLGYEFGKRTFVNANNHWVRLSFTPIDENGLGFTEPNVSIGYIPVMIPNSTDSWGIPSNMEVSNIVPFTFETFTASLPEDQKVIYWFISESETGGKAIYYGELDYPRPILIRSQIWLNTGEIKIKRTNPS